MDGDKDLEFYYRQLSADIKRKNYNIEHSFARPEGSTSQTNKTGLNLIIIT